MLPTIHGACSACGAPIDCGWDDVRPRHASCAPTRADALAETWLRSAESDPHGIAERNIAAELARVEAAPPALAAAALTYATWGWPVFPLRPAGSPCLNTEKCARSDCCQCPKRPATPHGFKDATTDPARIRDWWSRAPFNVGLAAGAAFNVVDVDPPAGPLTLARMIPDWPPALTIHGRAATASGGCHLYVAPTGQGNRAGMAPGVDYRGAGGYVIAPPSTLGPPGRAWTWTNHPGPAITARAP